MTSETVKLPGFGLPLNHTPKKDNEDGMLRGSTRLFPSALDSKDLEDCHTSLRLTPLREFTMLQIMNQLTDKPDWDKKIFEETILKKWKSELLSDPDRDITEKMVDYCFAELQYKVPLFQRTGQFTIYEADVVKSDVALSESFRLSLIEAVKPLEDVPEHQKDWHPGSDRKVLDLVHPSLFPLVYGKSRILEEGKVGLEDCVERCGDGKVVPVPPKEETNWVGEANDNTYYYGRNPKTLYFSRKFQWLPCEVDIGGEGTKITSYINNLHPIVHAPLYPLIEQLISASIPLWNTTLQPLKTDLDRKPRVPYDVCKYDPDPERFPEEEKPPKDPGEDENTYWERLEQWYEDTRRVVLPEPEEFTPPEGRIQDYMTAYDEDGKLKEEHVMDLRREFGGNGLQVIVKLANIELTPEKPEYEGGTWHVEGQLNEHICATAIYYYSSENITTSRLAFRQQCGYRAVDDIGYRQWQYEWLTEVFGGEQNGPTVQNIGTVDTLQGRLITFPNILQHQVQPFKLADPTKSGHRKIVALFLVDPHIKVISTANIPVQRRDWWGDRLAQGGMGKFPRELQDIVVGNVEEFPISMDEAKKLREELMEERKVFVVDSVRAFEQHTFSLCEH